MKHRLVVVRPSVGVIVTVVLVVGAAAIVVGVIVVVLEEVVLVLVLLGVVVVVDIIIPCSVSLIIVSVFDNLGLHMPLLCGGKLVLYMNIISAT